MKIAVVGSGISGLSAGYFLSKDHEVTLYESESRLGGHTATIETQINGQPYNIDTGFIVYNDWTYPNFERLLKELNVTGKPTEMGFSVTTLDHGFEYCGSTFSSLFAQKSNRTNPRFYRMLGDIVRFNQRAKKALNNNEIDPSLTLSDYLGQHNYGSLFLDYYITPMASAIWSCSTKTVRDFQALFFIRFFFQHGLLNITNRPQWHVVNGGSNQYIDPITQPYADGIRLNEKVTGITRFDDSVIVESKSGKEKFDYVVIATHSDQALALLSDPTQAEQDILRSIAYSENSVVMHTDTSLLPKSRKAWTSWNYLLDGTEHTQPVLTYHMNILQGIDCPQDVLVTVNGDEHIDPEKVLHRFSYSHPQLTHLSVSAQQRWSEINNQNRTLYCGAYWANGFHEDGLSSAIRAVNAIGVTWS